jgi:hypothetical protein
MKHIYPITFGVMLVLSLCFVIIGVRPAGHAQGSAGHGSVTAEK